MYSTCPLARLHAERPCKLCQAQLQARQNPSLSLERFRCSKCKRFRPITDYPLRDDDFRASTCRTCHEKDRDSYRERKGEPVSKEGRVRRFAQAQRVVERALRARIREERIKRNWLEARERWERGELAGVNDSFEEGVYRKGPYRQWVGYTDPREEGWEGVTGAGEAWEGESNGEGEESEGEGSLADGQDGWGEFLGEREGSAGSQEGRESSTGVVEEENSPQEQFCSSCNQKKPLIAFGRFLTCNTCRGRNRRVKQARQVKHKATYKVAKATREEIELSIQARASLTGEYILRGKFTRPLTIEDYLDNKDKSS
jgi:hypothetical protein